MIWGSQLHPPNLSLNLINWSGFYFFLYTTYQLDYKTAYCYFRFFFLSLFFSFWNTPKKKWWLGMWLYTCWKSANISYNSCCISSSVNNNIGRGGEVHEIFPYFTRDRLHLPRALYSDMYKKKNSENNGKKTVAGSPSMHLGRFVWLEEREERAEMSQNERGNQPLCFGMYW